MKNKWWQTVGGIVVFGFLLSLCSPKKENTPKPPEEIVFITESCSKMESLFGSSSKLSSAQKEDGWAKYDGKGFKWKLKVGEVHTNTLKDGYSVQYLCPNSDSLIVDITVSYPLEAKDLVLSFSKGKTYEVVGVLNRYSNYVGLSGTALLNYTPPQKEETQKSENLKVDSSSKKSSWFMLSSKDGSCIQASNESEIENNPTPELLTQSVEGCKIAGSESDLLVVDCSKSILKKAITFAKTKKRCEEFASFIKKDLIVEKANKQLKKQAKAQWLLTQKGCMKATDFMTMPKIMASNPECFIDNNFPEGLTGLNCQNTSIGNMLMYADTREICDKAFESFISQRGSF